MATFAISRPVGKRISRELFFESMKLIYAVLIVLLALMTSAQCQQTAYADAIRAFDEAIRLDPNDALAWVGKGNAL
jgi:Flp pilus assembly protein TadD